MSLGTKIFTWLHGELVGEDQFGNKYYRSKKKEEGYHIGRGKTERRWVIYNGSEEPSKVPPEWHGWLHYVNDKAPKSGAIKPKYDWQKPHIPNMTGTGGAYLPKGHAKKGGKRNKALGDYQAWDPKS